MANVKKKEVLDMLQSEDYQAGRSLGAGSVKHLRAIVNGSDRNLAAKATYLAGLLDTDKSAEVVEIAAKSRKPAIRVAAASAAGELSPERAERILDRLLKSRDLGVRKTALRAAERTTPKIRKRLESIQKEDPVKQLRKLAKTKLTKKWTPTRQIQQRIIVDCAE